MDILNKVKQNLNPLFDAVDDHFKDFAPLTRAANLLKLRPAYIVLTFFILAVVMLGTGYFSNLFVAIFGMIYPAYMTFKVLNQSDSEGCKEWLTYWIVFGFFTTFSGVVRHVFFFLSVKSYNVFRILFFIFLFHPVTRGASLIYNKFLRKTLVDATAEVEEKIKNL